MQKAALYKRRQGKPSPQPHKVQQNHYARKAFKKLHDVQAQAVNLERIFTILGKFTQRYFPAITLFLLIAFIAKVSFVGLLSLPSVQASSQALFFCTIGASFICNILIACGGLHLTKKLLLSREEHHKTHSFQGALHYLGFASIMSFLTMIIGFGVHMIAGSYEPIAAKIIVFVGTLLAAAMTSLIIVQYGLILPAAATNRKQSMALACLQARPFWSKLFPIIFTGKFILAMSVFIVSILSLPPMVSSLITALLSSVFSIYIYLILSASYAAAGYLFNTDYEIPKDVF